MSRAGTWPLGREREEDTEVLCRLHHLVRHPMNLECDACVYHGGRSSPYREELVVPAVAHPSQLLRQILHECGLSQSAFARAVGVTPMRVSHVINGTRSITAELRPAVRQGARQSPEYWLNLQAAHDLAAAQSTVGCAQRVERVA